MELKRWQPKNILCMSENSHIEKTPKKFPAQTRFISELKKFILYLHGISQILKHTS